ncbi:peptidoglycan-binding protein LysM [Flavobacterium sp. PL12]|uniref:peptidoglycan-binding protein LysM n=1 Tax=Flavobacterium sp. PL12 TaxID=3071718 RepID=UPI00319D907F
MKNILKTYLQRFQESLFLLLPFKSSTLSVLFISALFLTTSFAKAQEVATKVNITLADVLSIDSESAANGGAVDFRYETVSDYNSQKTATVPKSLVVTFSKAFDVKVRANGEYFENGINQIPINVITIQRNESSTLMGKSTPIILSTTDQVLVGSAALGLKLQLDLDYIIPKAKSSSTDILGKPAGSYTQTVTYTASAL